MMMDALKTSEGGGEKPEVWWGLKEVP
jgi:hypothetical protein